MGIDPWEKVLQLYYDGNRESVTATGFDIDSYFNLDPSFEVAVDGTINSGAVLVLKLIDMGRSMDRWTFKTIDDEAPRGVTFVAPDRLFFTNPNDALTAKSLLGI